MVSAAQKPPVARGSVKEACLDEALQIVREQGLDALSLREVSRRLGVSHQAPYKHFGSRDDIVAALMTRCFSEFAAALVATPPSGDPGACMRAMGEAYLAYARLHPTEYGLMFETPMPAPDDHPAMMHEARRAFSLLRDRLAAQRAAAPADGGVSLDLDSLFVWSVVHGLATILKSDVMATLDIDDADRRRVVAHCLDRIGAALGMAGETRAAPLRREPAADGR